MTMSNSHDRPISFRLFSDIFEYIPEQDFVFIYNTGRIHNIQSGEYLIREGAKDDTVYLIMEGELKVVKRSGQGQKKLATLGPGNWVGEIAFSHQVPRTASVVATTTSRVLGLTKNTFDSLRDHTKSALMQKFYSLAEERHYIFGSEQKKPKETKQDELTEYITENIDADSTIYSKSKLIQAIISNVPRLPIYAADLITKLNDAEISLNEVSNIIGQDPSLAAQVLRYVNSPYYGFRQKITDLKHAIILLGLNQIYLIVIFNAIRTTMPKTKEFKKLQIHSVIMSYMSAEFASLVDPDFMGLAGTLGLLHDIGKSVIYLLKFNYEEMGEVFDSLDYATLGSMLLKQWNLPDEISESIRCQNFFWLTTPTDIPEEYRKYVSILALAHLVTDYIAGKDVHLKSSPFLQEYLGVLNLSGYTIEQLAMNKILPSLRQKMKDMPLWIRNFIKKSPRLER